MNLKRTTLCLPLETHRMLKMRAAATGTPMAQILRALLARELDAGSPPPPLLAQSPPALTTR